jgi:hypothetical protein
MRIYCQMGLDGRYIRMGEDEFAEGVVQCESVDTVAGSSCKYQICTSGVHTVSSDEHICAGTEDIIGRRRLGRRIGEFIYSKNSSY